MRVFLLLLLPLLAVASSEPYERAQSDESDNLQARDVRALLTQKKELVLQLEERMKELELSSTDGQEIAEQRDKLQFRLKHLDDLERLSIKALTALRHAVLSNITDKVEAKEETLQRLKTSQLAALDAELEYQDLVEQEKEQESRRPKPVVNGTHNDLGADLGADVMQEVKSAADRLELGLQEHTFDEAQKQEGAMLETVVRVEAEEDKTVKTEANANQGSSFAVATPLLRRHGFSGVSFLIDPDDNLYVLAKPKDTTVPYEDARLLFDIIRLVASTFLCGWLVTTLGLPAIFGYILAGILLGPSSANVIKSFVQVETIAQLGIFFMLFVLGMEFSLDKLRGTWQVALYGSLSLMVLTCSITALIAFLLGARPAEGLVVGGCLALSSTAVVVTCLHSDDLDSSEGRAMIGILVLQDVFLGVLLAAMPVLTKNHTSEILWTIFQLGMATCLYLLIAYVLTRLIVNVIFKYLLQLHHPAIMLLGMLSHCFLMMYLAELLGLSLELGCFVAGLQASVRNAYVEQGLPQLLPVRDIFAALFFATIGLHVYPLFLYQQLPLLLMLTIGTVFFKFTAGFVFFRFAFGYSMASASEICIGLSQVSEFAFVVAARGKALGLVSREVYYLIIGTTALTLLTTPLLWKILPRPSKESVGTVPILTRSPFHTPISHSPNIVHSSHDHV